MPTLRVRIGCDPIRAGLVKVLILLVLLDHYFPKYNSSTGYNRTDLIFYFT
ncbi:hypothetical protein SEPL_514 [Salmonella phage SE_PL]|nr:hypothetical protein CPT_Munch_451 [Salmonella phage Munch]QCW18556.1 hypothetical protein 7t3_031 [Salmonella phage 7t3]QIG63127.1 hypothetical protein SEPL_514 [Salmonella phage SE_PL]